jgi:hypothetical protein
MAIVPLGKISVYDCLLRHCGSTTIVATVVVVLSVTTISYLVDPASSHMLVSKIKPCMSKYKPH